MIQVETIYNPSSPTAPKSCLRTARRARTSFVSPSIRLFQRSNADGKQDADQDLDDLIEKTENEETKEVAPTEGDFSFSFAKIWAAGKNTLEEVADDLPQEHEVDSWANTLQRIEAVKQMERKVEVTGRGVRRKAAAVFPKVGTVYEFSILNLTFFYIDSPSLIWKIPLRRKRVALPNQFLEKEVHTLLLFLALIQTIRPRLSCLKTL
jgi:hypothetical protein